MPLTNLKSRRCSCCSRAVSGSPDTAGDLCRSRTHGCKLPVCAQCSAGTSLLNVPQPQPSECSCWPARCCGELGGSWAVSTWHIGCASCRPFHRCHSERAFHGCDRLLGAGYRRRSHCSVPPSRFHTCKDHLNKDLVLYSQWHSRQLWLDVPEADRHSSGHLPGPGWACCLCSRNCPFCGAHGPCVCGCGSRERCTQRWTDSCRKSRHQEPRYCCCAGLGWTPRLAHGLLLQSSTGTETPDYRCAGGNVEVHPHTWNEDVVGLIVFDFIVTRAHNPPTADEADRSIKNLTSGGCCWRHCG